MPFFVVLWSYLLTTKLSCLQKNYFGHTTGINISSLFYLDKIRKIRHGLALILPNTELPGLKQFLLLLHSDKKYCSEKTSRKYIPIHNNFQSLAILNIFLNFPCFLLAFFSSYPFISMTQLLTHSVAHSTKPSSRPKANNQSIKKFLSLAVS